MFVCVHYTREHVVIEFGSNELVKDKVLSLQIFTLVRIVENTGKLLRRGQLFFLFTILFSAIIALFNFQAIVGGREITTVAPNKEEGGLALHRGGLANVFGPESINQWPTIISAVYIQLRS